MSWDPDEVDPTSKERSIKINKINNIEVLLWVTVPIQYVSGIFGIAENINITVIKNICR